MHCYANNGDKGLFMPGRGPELPHNLHHYALHNTLYFAMKSGIGIAVSQEEEYETEVYLALKAAYYLLDISILRRFAFIAAFKDIQTAV